VFTGDTLLIRGTGRTDFRTGDPRAQYESLFGRLLKLPDETLVYRHVGIPRRPGISVSRQEFRKGKNRNPILRLWRAISPRWQTAQGYGLPQRLQSRWVQRLDRGGCARRMILNALNNE
jgi:glyoxylase-like metal-dependent hydrolase (beta-lactamase superfamily II)